jgi:tRNA uridine 5-carboxymethylaminomethyl modification enzyme
VGPRYCPSVEDKVVRFAERDSHQLFLEPEGLNTHEVYPNGISTSLPYDVQEALVHSIRGLENAHITRPGYAIEYDFFDPRDLRPTLETKAIENLFFAGQINGTTGYEEAGAQGLLAGLNAAAKANDLETWSPRRDEAYLGVLVDDLITQGTLEPYRMFTSRAEHRLLLREDNADLRLTPVGRDLGLVDDTRWDAFAQRREAIDREWRRLEKTRLHPRDLDDAGMTELFGAPLARDHTLAELLRRPGVTYAALMQLPGAGPAVSEDDIAEQVETGIRYSGYLARQEAEIARNQRDESLRIPEALDYAEVPGLSNEVREKLARQRPHSLGQAGRIPGVTPAAVSLLRVYLHRLSRSNTAGSSRVA